MQHPQQVVSSSAELLQTALSSLQAQQLLAQNNQLAQALRDNLEPLESRQSNEEHEKNRKDSISGQNPGQFSIHSQMIDEKLGVPSKKCNCRQSQCIKLYCECYAAGAYCNGCHCIGCKNNDQSEGWRNKAIQNTLVKNPQAFLPKISQKQEPSKEIDPLNLGKHNKGCACKKSGCMKKYCECFQAGVPCSDNCKCSACSSIPEGNRPPKSNSVSIGQTQQRVKTPQKPETDQNKSNQNSSCDDIDMACQDEKMDEEEDQNEDQILNKLKSTGKCEEDEQIQGEDNETHRKDQDQGQTEENEVTQKTQEEEKNNNINNTEGEEHHSSEVTRRQQLFELRRTMILDTFLQLLRNVEGSINGE